MIKTLYSTFQHWSKSGSVYIISDTHFEDSDCELMDPEWVTPQEQVDIINKIVRKTDTLIHLGDVGNPEWIKKIKADYKVLIMGNHDVGASKYKEYFDEIYTGPLFIADKILLSHEPIPGISFALNIHGHNHVSQLPMGKVGEYNFTMADVNTHINLAANVCGYTPKSLSKIIDSGALKNISSIHRQTIDLAGLRKRFKELDGKGLEVEIDR
jgi:calcineurin-like phosphoesterase family protein